MALSFTNSFYGLLPRQTWIWETFHRASLVIKAVSGLQCHRSATFLENRMFSCHPKNTLRPRDFPKTQLSLLKRRVAEEFLQVALLLWEPFILFGCVSFLPLLLLYLPGWRRRAGANQGIMMRRHSEPDSGSVSPAA